MTETNRTPAPSDALRDAGQHLLTLLVQRAAQAATDQVSGLGDRLGAVSDGSQSVGSLLRGRDRSNGEQPDKDQQDQDESEGEGQKGRLARFFGGVKEKVQGALGAGGGDGGGQGKNLKVTNIIESIDIGLPLRTTYDLWTQLTDFPSFMKKVESVEQESDEKSNWKAQVFWSHRTWEATVLEQVPDSHIVWRSKGAKGHVDGAISFTEIGPNLTRVLVVLEYFPQGLFERTGNVWRAQGRRARLELKHFRRHAMTEVLLHDEDVEGWRGEIHDGEVVKTHEEALEEEQKAQGDEAEGPGEDEESEGEAQDAEDQAEDQPEDQADEEDSEAEDGAEEPEDEVDDQVDDQVEDQSADASDADAPDADDDDQDDDQAYEDDEEDAAEGEQEDTRPSSGRRRRSRAQR